MSAIMLRNFIYIIFKPYNHLKGITTFTEANKIFYWINRYTKAGLTLHHDFVAEPRSAPPYVWFQSLNVWGRMGIFNGSHWRWQDVSLSLTGVWLLWAHFLIHGVGWLNLSPLPTFTPVHKYFYWHYYTETHI